MYVHGFGTSDHDHHNYYDPYLYELPYEPDPHPPQIDTHVPAPAPPPPEVPVYHPPIPNPEVIKQSLNFARIQFWAEHREMLIFTVIITSLNLI